jgi:hypothetical protein
MFPGTNLSMSWGNLLPSFYHVQDRRKQTALKKWYISNKLASHPKDSIYDNSTLLNAKVKNLQSLINLHGDQSN